MGFCSIPCVRGPRCETVSVVMLMSTSLVGALVLYISPSCADPPNGQLLWLLMISARSRSSGFGAGCRSARLTYSELTQVATGASNCWCGHVLIVFNFNYQREHSNRNHISITPRTFAVFACLSCVGSYSSPSRVGRTRIQIPRPDYPVPPGITAHATQRGRTLTGLNHTHHIKLIG
ncbi:hypothetical protein BD779DRAFT_988276 [Infundibulicybe gibba]|nr:hypothetical protein BD779DRAFT_988276 [Infundibulicybe gibba]